jgi:UDP-N-acetylmuramate dehydrogenase
MITEHISLKHLNSFGIDAWAKYFASFTDKNNLEVCLENASNLNQSMSLHPLILGGGSNILFTRDVDGLVLKNEITGIETIGEDDDHVFVKAGAGENWHRFVMHCIDHGFAGVENLALIPGSVGASPMQNIGAYGVEIKDVFHSLEAYHIADKKWVTFNRPDCAFGYRESVFKNKFKQQFIIGSVTYQLNKKPVFNTSYGAITQELEAMQVTELSIQAVAQAVMRIRSSKLPDPAVIGNAGSFFKNPEVDAIVFDNLKAQYPGIVGYRLDNGRVKLAAGWLIEHCGPRQGTSWKGYRIGDAGCHTKQALVLVNYGHASGKQILDLSDAIIQSVLQNFSVKLEREVNIV